MAPVELQTTPSYVPAGIVATHIFAVGYVSVVALRTIYRSYIALPPSSATRFREPLRQGYVQVFSLLALVSLTVATYFGVRFGSLSYRVWATERGVELPDGFFGDNGALRGGEHPGRLQIVRWLNDTPLYRDALEIIAEKARYFWWGQQVNLSLVSWSTYLAIEGQRRKIPNLWAFLALAQILNLSYAQNLFFVTILHTPVPLPENVRDLTRSSVPSWGRYAQIMARVIPAKPEGFVPKPALYTLLLLSNFAATFLIPYASNTPSFMTVSLLSRALPFSFLALPYIIPESWGTVHNHPHETHTTYTRLFRTISTISALLHFKASFFALFHNTPESTYYRHSLLHPFKEEHRSALNRGSTALSRVFGAILEHPAVSAFGGDVLLSGLSVGIWAAIRGLDPADMLGSSVPFLPHKTKELEDVSASIKQEAEKAVQHIETTPATRRRGRPKGSEKSTPDLDETSTVSHLKRRGRPSKIHLTDGDDANDTTYKPDEIDEMEEGDENADEDWEVGALAWGLITAGGLGTGSASIYGAEVVAR
ncbi:hypothetical protein L207DRAFT_515186 [Hyaloscypha variabilis F]|uniref:Uncharacterized protein n=1 Tax=Hyaloscypha variabilis (strain UAMH 11265 / GT02V1 / F) TaxID=1149755 RepID=A0A2J6RDS9_HYAVF|nr:hypothetical protein L207DRAFT_515186 [Hyaloscypha variabilis F]